MNDRELWKQLMNRSEDKAPLWLVIVAGLLVIGAAVLLFGSLHGWFHF